MVASHWCPLSSWFLSSLVSVSRCAAYRRFDQYLSRDQVITISIVEFSHEQFLTNIRAQMVTVLSQNLLRGPIYVPR